MKNFTTQSVFSFLVLTLFTCSLLANGLEYRIKINASSDSTMTVKLSQFTPVRKSQESTEVGSYSSYILAMKGMYVAEDLGFSQTEIKAYFNQQSITLDDAFALENNRNQLDEIVQNQTLMSKDEMENVLRSVQTDNFYYAVQISLETERNINKFFDFPKKVDESITTKGYYRYTFGSFTTFQDVKDAMQMLVEYEIEGLQIVAFDNLERIPLTIAQEKERVLLEESLAANR
jgi:hypothetical protein